MSAVEIFGEVEEMDLERQLQSVDRRPAAQVRDGVAPPWRLPVVDCRPHRIHAECRNQLLAHVDVGRRESDRPSTFVAMLHPALAFPPLAEKPCGADGPTRPQPIAYARRDRTSGV